MATGIDDLKKKRDQLNARIQKAEALKRDNDSKADTKVKVLVGAAVLNSIKNGGNSELGMAKLMTTLQSFLTRDRDREAVLGIDGKGSEAFKRLAQKEKPAEQEKAQPEPA